ncbi:MAG: DUF2520 domain-containing protein [Firmicutes bacterium]|nr:DUF2520 domain-containing protein [Bacillota bacterium]
MENKKFKITIIGAGKVGVAVGYLLSKKGHKVVTAVARTDTSLKKAAPFLAGTILTKNAAYATEDVDIILITTKDAQIKPVCDSLVQEGAILPHHTVIHMSGAGSLDLLAKAKSAGARIASIHPIQSFASIELAIEKIPGSYFGVTAEGLAEEITKSLVDDLGGKAVAVMDMNKTLYHTAASIASNYLVTLFNLAQRLFEMSGIRERDALKAMLPLIKGTISNIEEVGTVDALTGPIARGDTKTVKQHLEALKNLDSDIIDIYKSLGRLTVDIALKKGTISEEEATRIIEMLDNQ